MLFARPPPVLDRQTSSTVCSRLCWRLGYCSRYMTLDTILGSMLQSMLLRNDKADTNTPWAAYPVCCSRNAVWEMKSG